MAIQLLVNVFRVPAVGDLAVGASVTLPHGLLSNDVEVPPTLIQPDRASPIIVTAVTATTVTFQNQGTAPTYATFRCERGLSNEVDVETLTPSFWQGAASGGGGGGGVNLVTATLPLTATGFPNTDIALNTTANLALAGTDLDLSNTGVAAASYGNLAAPNQSIVPTFTVDAKGRLTGAASGAIQIGGSDAKTYVDTQVSGAVSAVSIAKTYYVATTGSDATGTGSLMAPMATLAGALARADLDYPGTYPALAIAITPGVYPGSTEINRHNVFIQGSTATKPEEWAVKLGPITVNCTAASSLFADQVGISGCFIETTLAGSKALNFASSGPCSLLLDNCYFNSDSTGVAANALSQTGNRLIATGCVFRTNKSGPSVLSLTPSTGSTQMSDIRVYPGSSVTAGATTISTGAGTVFLDRALIEPYNTAAAITVGGSLILSNSSIRATNGPGILFGASSIGQGQLVWNTYFDVPPAQSCLSGSAAIVSYGQLSFAALKSVTLAAGPNYTFPVSEVHGTTYIPSLGSGVVVKGSANAPLTVVLPGTAGNVLTSDGTNWTSAAPAISGPGLVPVPAGSAVFTVGKAVTIDSTGVLALANATDLLTSPAVGLYVAGGYIRVAGEQPGLSGLVAGTAYYLDTVAGGLTSTPPATSGNVIQYIGRATSATSLFVSPTTIVVV